MNRIKKKNPKKFLSTKLSTNPVIIANSKVFQQFKFLLILVNKLTLLFSSRAIRSNPIYTKGFDIEFKHLLVPITYKNVIYILQFLFCKIGVCNLNKKSTGF